MLGVTVNIQGDAAFMAKLAKIEPSLHDFKKALEIIGTGMVHYYSNDVFKSQGGQYGPSWQQLSPATLALKAKHFRAYANVPLVATGTMKNSFEARAEAQKLTISNSAPYFVYHQSSAPRSKLPRRQMLGIDNKMKQLIRDVIRADVKAKLARL
jgi:phage gpG-like protein